MKSFLWEPAARADLRKLDRETAVRILLILTRYGDTGEGDVKMLTDRDGLYRLRVGKWRLLFDLDSPGIVRIHGIDNRGASVLITTRAVPTDSTPGMVRIRSMSPPKKRPVKQRMRGGSLRFPIINGNPEPGTPPHHDSIPSNPWRPTSLGPLRSPPSTRPGRCDKIGLART
jgi:mRNA interferase RelE/StbE